MFYILRGSGTKNRSDCKVSNTFFNSISVLRFFSCQMFLIEVLFYHLLSFRAVLNTGLENRYAIFSKVSVRAALFRAIVIILRDVPAIITKYIFSLQ